MRVVCGRVHSCSGMDTELVNALVFSSSPILHSNVIAKTYVKPYRVVLIMFQQTSVYFKNCMFLNIVHQVTITTLTIHK